MIFVLRFCYDLYRSVHDDVLTLLGMCVTDRAWHFSPLIVKVSPENEALNFLFNLNLKFLCRSFEAGGPLTVNMASASVHICRQSERTPYASSPLVLLCKNKAATASPSSPRQRCES